MKILDEVGKQVEELRRYILPCLVVFIFLIVFFFVFGIEKIRIFGRTLYLFLPSKNAFSVLLFKKLKDELIPQGVNLIATDPLSAFQAQISISVILAVILGLPYFFYKTMRYLSPALLKKERNNIIKLFLLTTSLFIGGCVFTYYYLLPKSFELFYFFPKRMGIVPLFTVDRFILYVLVLVGFSGIMFLLPILMFFLTYLGLVERSLWLKKWKYAILVILIISAIITPGGGGLTMTIFSLPLIALYFLGYLLTLRIHKSR